MFSLFRLGVASVEKFVGCEGADGEGVDAAGAKVHFERLFHHALAHDAGDVFKRAADDEDAVVAAAAVAGVSRVEVAFVGKLEYVGVQVR